MAKLSMIEKEKKRAAIVEKYSEKRKLLKATIKNPLSSPESVDIAALALQKLPRNSSPCRVKNRCQVTGRPKGYYRKFGLSRNKIRESAMRGEIPGLVMASW